MTIDTLVRDLTKVHPRSKSEVRNIIGAFVREEIARRAGMLRQWLNEERIDDPKKFVTNADIEFMMGCIDWKELNKRNNNDTRKAMEYVGKFKRAIKKLGEK